MALHPSAPTLHKTFRALTLPGIDDRFQAAFADKIPHYRAWFLQEGEQQRPSLAQSLKALAGHMPEMLPLYQQLIDLYERDDLSARMLSLYNPTSYVRGCSLLNWQGGQLLRNYDYPPQLCDGIILHSQWQGMQVIGMTDCIWGLLDGINEQGLAIAFSFGGRQVRGNGFAVSLIVRYLLQTCTSVGEATRRLHGLPVNVPYTLALMDRNGGSSLVAIGPDIAPTPSPAPYAANRQDWVAHSVPAAGIETQQDSALRESALAQLTALPPGEPPVPALLTPPLCRHYNYRGRWGTAYTAQYTPRLGQACYHWPDFSWPQGFAAFNPGVVTRHYHRQDD